jgi:flagellum-specific peptidoglycan hydrolase FlgJ
MSLTAAQTQFAQQMVDEATTSGHLFPGYAAAEACLESAWGASGLCIRDKDVFGLKAAEWWTGQVDDIITREVINGVSEMVTAKWPVFETYADAFSARLHTLNLLPSRYGEALAAKTGPEFVRLVSAAWFAPGTKTDLNLYPEFDFPSGRWQFNKDVYRWSTAPNRASEVLAVYNNHPDIFG